MAVSSLRYKAGSSAVEDKFGFVQYGGAPHEFHHWEFRTKLKMAASNDDEKVKTIARIIENLKGDALDIAMEIGSATLLQNPDVDDLIERIKKHIFPSVSYTHLTLPTICSV